MKTKTHFAFRIDIWDDVVEHVAGVDDFEGGWSDLPGGRGALACGPDHPTAGRAGRA
jgi:hypothetical protein